MIRSTPGLLVHHQLPEFTQTHVHRAGDAIQPSHPQSSLLLLPPIPPSIRVFSNESTLHMRWVKYWSFSLSISPSNEHPGLISNNWDAVKVLHSVCQQIWKTQQWPQNWKRSVFIPIPKKGNAKECSNYRTIALI